MNSPECKHQWPEWTPDRILRSQLSRRCTVCDFVQVQPNPAKTAPAPRRMSRQRPQQQVAPAPPIPSDDPLIIAFNKTIADARARKAAAA